ncbi:hypothetical protein V6N13_052433 [Hibiscus sabdariffa]
MEESMILNSLLSIITLVFCFKLLIQSRISHKNLPPTPPSIPFLGHVHLIKQPLHRSYHRLSQKYGPIISLRYGTCRVVLVSSSTAAEECFTKLDIVLANRPYLLIGKYICYNYSSMVASPYGDHFRNLRRISAIEIFSSSRLNAFQGIRKDEVKQLLMKLRDNSSSSSSSTDDPRQGFGKVELKSMFIELALNNIMRMVAGKRYDGGGVGNEREAKEFRELMEEGFAVGGVSHPADFFPILKWIGGRKHVRKLKDLGERMDRFLQSLIDEIRGKNQSGTTTMVHHLLSLQQADPHYYTDQIIKGLIQVSFI